MCGVSRGICAYIAIMEGDDFLFASRKYTQSHRIIYLDQNSCHLLPHLNYYYVMVVLFLFRSVQTDDRDVPYHAQRLTCRS